MSQRDTGVAPPARDFLRAQPARFGGELMGRKPIAFCAWLFQLLGAAEGDSLDDLFPGTGVVTKCWQQLYVAADGVSDALEACSSPRGVDDGSPEHSGDVAQSSSEAAA